jgi:hypothetical protein
MRRENYIKVTLSDDELAKLDERRPDGLTRAQWLRELARGSAGTTSSLPARRSSLFCGAKLGTVKRRPPSRSSGHCDLTRGCETSLRNTTMTSLSSSSAADERPA